MGDQYGGKREGAGRKKGSKNKTTIAREVIGEIIDAPDPMKLESATRPCQGNGTWAATRINEQAAVIDEGIQRSWHRPWRCKAGKGPCRYCVTYY